MALMLSRLYYGRRLFYRNLILLALSRSTLLNLLLGWLVVLPDSNSKELKTFVDVLDRYLLVMFITGS